MACRFAAPSGHQGLRQAQHFSAGSKRMARKQLAKAHSCIFTRPLASQIAYLLSTSIYEANSEIAVWSAFLQSFICPHATGSPSKIQICGNIILGHRRYMILQLYLDHGTTISVIVKAPRVLAVPSFRLPNLVWKLGPHTISHHPSMVCKCV